MNYVHLIVSRVGTFQSRSVVFCLISVHVYDQKWALFKCRQIMFSIFECILPIDASMELSY